MADGPEEQLPGRRGAEAEAEPSPDRHRGSGRHRGHLPMSAKLGFTAKLPETLGFYDLNERKRQRDYAAGTANGPLKGVNHLINIKLPAPIWLCILVFMCVRVGDGVIVSVC